MATKSKTAVIIGSGAGGSMAALALAQSGRFDRITVLEKGPNYYQGLGRPNFSDMSVAFSNDEIKFGQRAGSGASSDSLDDPDVLLDPRSFRTSTGVAREFVGDVQSLPQLVGGGLTHADWKARRLRPADFRLKTLADQFGYNITNSTTVDWPISYDDLEPFYALAEQIIGVQGPAQLPAPFAPRRSGPYPMPPGVPQFVAKLITAGAEQVGLSPFPAPTGITSRPYRGRPACNDCGFDVGFACPIGAKSTPAVTALRDALLTGRVSLRPDSHVFRLNMGKGGREVESVAFLDEDGGSARRFEKREITAIREKGKLAGFGLLDSSDAADFNVGRAFRAAAQFLRNFGKFHGAAPQSVLALRASLAQGQEGSTGGLDYSLNRRG